MFETTGNPTRWNTNLTGICSPSGKSIGPTQKWNLILGIFYDQVPLKRHWRLLWPYDNSFTGKEGVDFLLQTLPKIIINTSINRYNCFQLLQKFLKEGLVICCKNPKDKKLFDDNTIYKFDVKKVEHELYKTANSSFNDASIPSFCPRPYSSCDDVSNQDENTIEFQRMASSFRTPKNSKKSNFFSSFRKKTPPVFIAPPPPEETPPASLSKLYIKTPLVDVHQSQVRQHIISRKRLYGISRSPIPNKVPKRF